MSQSTLHDSLKITASELSELEDSSPFGLQGLSRNSVRIIKPEFINRLAVNLALRGTRKQIQDLEYVEKVLSWHPEWCDEYQIVHLIEKSLWIQGHSDLVMTMTRNPSQIPDNPPEKIKMALMNAYMHHPEATIWYGVPLFSEARNEEGLPIPVTASEVRAESQRRLKAAQDHALRWRWFFRLALAGTRLPVMCWQLAAAVRQRIRSFFEGIGNYWKQCRRDAKVRARAIIMAELEHARFGCSMTEIPEHRTWLGRSLETACVIFELLAYQAQVVGVSSPFFGLVAAPLMFAKFVPVLFVPITIVTCDPFLFVELPEEPGKLRHIGHWYWQKKDDGSEKLHLHV